MISTLIYFFNCDVNINKTDWIQQGTKLTKHFYVTYQIKRSNKVDLNIVNNVYLDRRKSVLQYQPDIDQPDEF